MLIRGSTLTMIDRSLGFVFGIVRGVLIVCLVYLVASSILWPDIDKPVEQQVAIDQPVSQQKPSDEKVAARQKLTMSAPKWLMAARTRPMLAGGADMLKEFIPDSVLEKTTDEILEQKKTVQDKMSKEFKDNMNGLTAKPPEGER